MAEARDLARDRAARRRVGRDVGRVAVDLLADAPALHVPAAVGRWTASSAGYASRSARSPVRIATGARGGARRARRACARPASPVTCRRAARTARRARRGTRPGGRCARAARRSGRPCARGTPCRARRAAAAPAGARRVVERAPPLGVVARGRVRVGDRGLVPSLPLKVHERRDRGRPLMAANLPACPHRLVEPRDEALRQLRVEGGGGEAVVAGGCRGRKDGSASRISRCETAASGGRCGDDTVVVARAVRTRSAGSTVPVARARPIRARRR